MLALACSGHPPFLQIVIDGTQKALNNQWSILSIGFTVRRQDLSWTSSRKESGECVQLMAPTTTMQPSMQAFIDQESAENVADALWDAPKLYAEMQWLFYMHEDYSTGIEAARVKKFAL